MGVAAEVAVIGKRCTVHPCYVRRKVILDGQTVTIKVAIAKVPVKAQKYLLGRCCIPYVRICIEMCVECLVKIAGWDEHQGCKNDNYIFLHILSLRLECYFKTHCVGCILRICTVVKSRHQRTVLSVDFRVISAVIGEAVKVIG